MIKSGDFEGACIEADAQSRQSPSLLPLRNKLKALLHLQRCSEAEQLGREIMEREPGESQSDFIFLGIAVWCQLRFDEALDIWKEAIHAKYTDAAGGVRAPLLLVYGSVERKDAGLRTRSMKLLSDRPQSPNWPGPLASYVTGNLPEADLRSQISTQPILRARQACQAEFYIGMMHRIYGDDLLARESMRFAYEKGPPAFLEGEYYLAKWDYENSRSHGSK